MKKSRTLLLAICKGIYCCWFFAFFCAGIYLLSLVVKTCLQSHSVPALLIYKSSGVIVSTIVTGIACLLILVRKSASSGWAVAACFVLTFSWVADLTSENWRKVVEDQLTRWPWTLFGIIGIVLFIFPHRGWRRRAAIPCE